MYADKENGTRELQLAQAFAEGVNSFWEDSAFIQQSNPKEPLPEADAICIVGVKSAKHFRRIREAGKNVIFFDKGYTRHRGAARTWEYWRVAVNTHHPTEYIATARHTPERWNAVRKARKIKVKPWRDLGDHVVYAGSSAKYHAFCGLEDPTEYAKKVIKGIHKVCNRRVIYRPKPTWTAAVPIKGSTYSPRAESLSDVLPNAWCLVTHGSNACFDAALEGIPAIVLGDAIAKPISSHLLEDIPNPRLATDEEREQWLSNIAWCQFTEEEMKDGFAWAAIRNQLRCLSTQTTF